ncbi:MAG: DUF1499 domain-containing protein [Candidatus Binataceae bacterium]
MTPEWFALIDGIAAFAIAAAGIAGAHFYLLSPMTGFSMVFFVGFTVALIGVAVGLFARHRYRDPRAAVLRKRATAGLAVSAAVAIPIALFIGKGLAGGRPAINDITTDVNNPPEFIHAQTLPANRGRDLKYDKALYAARQRAGYGIVAPLKEKLDPAAAFKRVQEVAMRVPAWTITYRNPAAMTIEGVAVSKLFRFPDDFAIQVRPAPGGGSLIEMRSKSRNGKGDFGVNHRRIEHFFDRLALARGAPATEEIP